MIDRDPLLTQMLTTMSAMPARDRAFVLDLLGDQDSRRLAPLLRDLKGGDFSTTLRALGDEARSGGIPSGMTERGATSLRAAFTAQSREAAPTGTVSAPPASRWRDLMARMLTGRG